MAKQYLAVLSIDGFDAIRRDAGYLRAARLLDQLRADLINCMADAREVRATRTTVEFVFACASLEAAERRLTVLRDRLAGEMPVRRQALVRTVTAAAVPCRHGAVTGRLVAQVEALLVRAQHEAAPVLVAAAALAGQDEDRLMADLQRALAQGGLALHYQPKLHARDGTLAGAEALLRWTHPRLGAVPPDLFIPMAERSGDIRAVTDWVLDRALADQATFADAGLSIPAHINVSAPLVAEAGFTDAMLARMGDRVDRIGLEITETQMIADPERTLARLQDFAQAGVRLSIDDYGTGFSSLAYLQRLPVQELKIDRAFICGLSTSARDPLLVRSTIDLAHALEMEVVAEGVETAASLALLQVMGCDMVQGYFLSRPVPIDQLIVFARTNASGGARVAPMSLKERIARRRGTGDQA